MADGLNTDGARELGYNPDVPLPPPAGMDLVQVHLFVRHGERTQLALDGKNFPSYPAESWDRCKEVAPGQDMAVRQFSSRTGRGLVDDLCTPGQLTDQGCARLRAIGSKLRDGYGLRDGLLPVDRPDPDAVFLRATGYQRVCDSLRCLLSGLWPEHRGTQLKIYTADDGPKSEFLYSNPGACPRLKELMEEYKKGDELARVNEEFVKRPAVSRLVDDYVGLRDPKLAVFDMMQCRYAHGEQLPAGAGVDDLRAASHAAASEWVQPWYSKREMTRLSMGRLIGAVSDGMRAALGQPLRHGTQPPWGARQAPSLVVYSGHDTTVGPFAGALGSPLPGWPLFGTTLQLELLRRRSDGTAVARFIRNGEVARSIAGVKADADGLVEWKDLDPALSKLVPEDFWAECIAKQERIVKRQTDATPANIA